MISAEKSVYISYSWGAEKRHPLVDELLAALDAKGIKVKRDKNAINYGDSIRAYMDELAAGGAIILMLSDEYFKSRNCMYELREIYLNNQREFRKRIFPVVLKGTKFHRAADRIPYIKHWVEEKVTLNDELSSVPRETLSDISHNELRDYADFCRIIDELLALISDMYSPAQEEHLKTGFSALIERIFFHNPPSGGGSEKTGGEKKINKMNTMFLEAIETAQERFREEIERSLKWKEADPARINRRKKEQYHERLTRSCLGVDMKSELNDSLYALAVAIPEGLISKMYFLAWGDARRQKQTDAIPNQLMKSYSEAFSSSYKVKTKNLSNLINGRNIDKSLICNLLSPESDTILVLAELGRSVRLTKALELKTMEILLADISWVKYDKSISQKFDSNKIFLDKLRVCIDKRKMLYRALNLKYTTFGITDYGENDSYIKKTNILGATEKYRELAKVLWGERRLSQNKLE